jgi:hypothetical protein
VANETGVGLNGAFGCRWLPREAIASFLAAESNMKIGIGDIPKADDSVQNLRPDGFSPAASGMLC